MERDELLKLEHITVRYGDRMVLDDLSFTIYNDEFVVLIGENGAGKTTLFRVIMQMIPYERGEIIFDNRVLCTKKACKYFRSMVGYVPQKQVVGNFPISVFDAVMLGRWGKYFSFVKKPSQADRQAIENILDIIGLTHLKNRDCRFLSGGQMQKVNIAQALVREPCILLLDEPTSYLDIKGQESFYEVINLIRLQMKLNVFMISHNLRDIESDIDRTMVLSAGKVNLL